MNNIKFIYFDMGGVFFRWSSGLHAMAKMSGKSYDKVFEIWDAYDEEASRGNLLPQEMWNKLKEKLKISEEIEDFSEWFVHRFEPIAETHKLAQHLQASYDLGILSNIHTGFFDKILKKGYIPDLPYASIVQSCDIGVVKPEKEIFEYAQSLTRVPSEDIFYIDDSPRHTRMASSIGWSAYQFVTDNPRKSVDDILAILAGKVEQL